MRFIESRLAAPAMAVAACAWAVLLPLAAVAGGRGTGVDRPLALVYVIGQAICHQRIERSFLWNGIAWPVCARCSGIYAGAALGTLWALLSWPGRIGRGGPVIPLAPAQVRRWLALALTPTLVSVVVEWTSGVSPSNGVRAACGALAGSVVALLLSRFLQEHEVN